MYADEIDMSCLKAMLDYAKEYYLNKGYPPEAAYKQALQVVEEERGYSRGKHSDRFANRMEAAYDPLSYGGGRDKFRDVEGDRYRAGRGCGQSSRKEHDEYGCGRGRGRASWDEYAVRDPSPRERYSTLQVYTERELRGILEEIYDEWIKKGASRKEARREVKKWFNRNKGRGTGSSSPRSPGFNSSHPSRTPRAGKSRASGSEASQFDWDFTHESNEGFRQSNRRGPHGYRTEERRPGDYRTEERRPGGPWNGEFRPARSESPSKEDSRHSSGRVPRGYRAEERRPGGFSSGDYTGYDKRKEEPSGVKPDVDLYEVLGVPKLATAEEIKAAHRKLCIKHHPDRVKGGLAATKAATEVMAQINQASDVLKDRDMRAFYDQTGLIASVGASPDA